MNYHNIRKYDIANGKHLRTTIFFTGCRFHCPDCFNREIWDFNSGKPFDEEAKKELFTLCSDPHCAGLSVLGGEPMQQGMELYDLLVEFHKLFPEKDVWLWTGYYLNELNEDQMKIALQCDYVVDGRFQKELHGTKKLLFRGSENQTIWHNVNGEFIKDSMNDQA